MELKKTKVMTPIEARNEIKKKNKEAEHYTIVSFKTAKKLKKEDYPYITEIYAENGHIMEWPCCNDYLKSGKKWYPAPTIERMKRKNIEKKLQILADKLTEFIPRINNFETIKFKIKPPIGPIIHTEINNWRIDFKETPESCHTNIEILRDKRIYYCNYKMAKILNRMHKEIIETFETETKNASRNQTAKDTVL